MRRLVFVALFVAACGSPPRTSTPGDWALATRVTLPSGADLAPDDAANPGIAASQAVAYAHGRVFAVLANLAAYRVAGPSFVSIHDGQTLAAQSLVKLERDGKRCTNAGGARRVGETILVSCAGLVSLDEDLSTDGAVAELSAMDGSVQRITVVGNSPGSVLKFGTSIWLGDLESPSLLRVNSETGAVLNGLGGAAPIAVCRSGYVSALGVIEGRTFASCFNNDMVQEFDPATGARIGEPMPTGDGPIHMATFSDRIALVDSLAGTLSFIWPTMPANIQQHAVFVAGQQGGNDVEGFAGDAEWAAAAGAGFGTLAIFDVKQDFKLVAAIDMKASATAPTNSPYGVAMGDGAFYVSIAGWSQPGELVRVARSAQ